MKIIHVLFLFRSFETVNFSRKPQKLDKKPQKMVHVFFARYIIHSGNNFKIYNFLRFLGKTMHRFLRFGTPRGVPNHRKRFMVFLENRRKVIYFKIVPTVNNIASKKTCTIFYGFRGKSTVSKEQNKNKTWIIFKINKFLMEKSITENYF